MSTTVYDVGDTARLSAKFQVGGADADPTVVTCTIKVPTGVSTTYTYGADAELAKDSVGDYHVDWPCAVSGLHWYEFRGTNAVASAGEGKFFVRESRA